MANLTPSLAVHMHVWALAARLVRRKTRALSIPKLWEPVRRGLQGIVPLWP